MAFTLPSALLLIAFAYGADLFGGPIGHSVIHGLKLVAVAVVAQAVWGMARQLTPDRTRATIALAAVAIVVFAPTSAAQIAAIAAGALAGSISCRGLEGGPAGALPVRVSPRLASALLGVFALLFFGLPLAAALWPSPTLALFDAFYRAGALVFGGGHVVLPLLEAHVVESGWISQDGSWPATARRRRFRARCSPSPHIWAR